jgi:hypothetical protein
MPTFLFTVEDVFEIPERGVIPTPGVPISIRGIRNGLCVELRKPDGTKLENVVADVVMVDPYDPQRPIPIGLRSLTKQDVPIGTEIWMRE